MYVDIFQILKAFYSPPTVAAQRGPKQAFENDSGRGDSSPTVAWEFCETPKVENAENEA